MLLINYFRWMRRWKVNWEKDNWRDQHEDAYGYFIQWREGEFTDSDEKRVAIADAVRVAKHRQFVKNLPPPPRLKIEHRYPRAHRMVEAINKLTWEHAKINVTMRRAASNEQVEVSVCSVQLSACALGVSY